MTHEELKKRIKNIETEDLKKMSPHNVATLTDNFCEELVKYFLLVAGSNIKQREIIKLLMQKYSDWRKEVGDILWGAPHLGDKYTYPEYLTKWEFDIECGETIQDETLVTLERARLDDVNQHISVSQKRIKELEAENADLKKQIEQRDDKTKTLKADTQEDNATLFKELEEAKRRIAELEAEINELKEFHEVDEQFKEIEWHDKVRLAVLLRLLQKDGADLEKYGNKAAAARLMSSITGLPLQTCKNFCTEPVVSSEEHKEELLQMNLELQRLGMKTRV